MRRVLISAGWGVLLLGLVVGGAALGYVVGDSGFTDAADAYARHRDHPLFQAQYWAAAVPHYALLTLGVLSPLCGLVGGLLLLGQAAVLRQAPPPDGGG